MCGDGTGRSEEPGFIQNECGAMKRMGAWDAFTDWDDLCSGRVGPDESGGEDGGP